MSFFLGIYNADAVHAAFEQKSTDDTRNVGDRATSFAPGIQLQQDWANLVDLFSWTTKPKLIRFDAETSRQS